MQRNFSMPLNRGGAHDFIHVRNPAAGCVTQQQGLFGAFMFLVPSILLSGFATPIANMPILLQRLTLINPLRYFLIILRGVFLKGDSVSLLFPQFWPLAVIGIVSLAMAGWLFRHKMY